MIAGYIGGRKAGTPVKGFFATLLPVILVFMVYGLMRMGILPGLDTLWTSGFDLISSVASGIPLIGPIMDFSLHYLGFLSGYIGMGSAWLAPYALMVLFGYAGGVMSLHHKRELSEYEHALEKAIQTMVQAFSQAAMGTTIEVPTVSKSANMTVPAGVQTGHVIQLRGKGLPHLRRGGAGDLYVRVVVVTPQKLSDEQRQLFEKLQASGL